MREETILRKLRAGDPAGLEALMPFPLLADAGEERRQHPLRDGVQKQVVVDVGRPLLGLHPQLQHGLVAGDRKSVV